MASASRNPISASGASTVRPNSISSMRSHVARRTSTSSLVMALILSGFAVDEVERQLALDMIGELLRRRFHEIAGGSCQRAPYAAVQCQLRATYSVDHD